MENTSVKAIQLLTLLGKFTLLPKKNSQVFDKHKFSIGTTAVLVAASEKNQLQASNKKDLLLVLFA